MVEELLVTARHNYKVDPSLAIWSWEIPVYLFLGGLTAGIMCFAGYAVLARKATEMPFTHDRYALWAPVALSVGMTALFLDLEHKLFVFRFYTSFEPASPMSWGAWILLLAGIVLMLRVSIHLPSTRLMTEGRKLGRLHGPIESLSRWATARARTLDWTSIVVGAALAFYTGILLSTIPARPLWDSAALAIASAPADPYRRAQRWGPVRCAGGAGGTRGLGREVVSMRSGHSQRRALSHRVSGILQRKNGGGRRPDQRLATEWMTCLCSKYTMKPSYSQRVTRPFGPVSFLTRPNCSLYL